MYKYIYMYNTYLFVVYLFIYILYINTYIYIYTVYIYLYICIYIQYIYINILYVYEAGFNHFVEGVQIAFSKSPFILALPLWWDVCHQK